MSELRRPPPDGERGIALVAALFSFSFTGAARAEIAISITQGHLNPMPIAVPDFSGQNPQEVEVGRTTGQTKP